jgi:hypothetical protein
VTVVPDVPVGTLNVHVNVPVPLVVKEPLVQLVIFTPSKTNPTVLVTEKSVPDTVTVVPTGPCVGLIVIAGVVTINTPVAVCPPTSVAVTVVPAAPRSTVIVQLNVPESFVVKEPPPVQLEIFVESNSSDVRAVDTEKPVPDTVTMAPTGPRPGVTIISGVVMVKLAVDVSDPPSFPATTTLYGTLLAASVGTVNVQEKVPVPEVA